MVRVVSWDLPNKVQNTLKQVIKKRQWSGLRLFYQPYFLLFSQKLLIFFLSLWLPDSAFLFWVSPSICFEFSQLLALVYPTLFTWNVLSTKFPHQCPKDCFIDHWKWKHKLITQIKSFISPSENPWNSLFYSSHYNTGIYFGGICMLSPLLLQAKIVPLPSLHSSTT